MPLLLLLCAVVVIPEVFGSPLGCGLQGAARRVSSSRSVFIRDLSLLLFPFAFAVIPETFGRPARVPPARCGPQGFQDLLLGLLVVVVILESPSARSAVVFPLVFDKKYIII